MALKDQIFYREERKWFKEAFAHKLTEAEGTQASDGTQGQEGKTEAF